MKKHLLLDIITERGYNNEFIEIMNEADLKMSMNLPVSLSFITTSEYISGYTISKKLNGVFIVDVDGDFHVFKREELE